MRMVCALSALLAGVVSGKAYEIKVPGVKDAVLVSLPENHDPAKRWPAVFSYHGFNGSPATTMTRDHTGSKDWIVVGMAYAQPGKYQLDEEGIVKELKVFRFVRDDLARKQGLDLKRIYVTGYSKGGWVTDALLRSEGGLAGGAILMGGQVPKIRAKAGIPGPDTEVFIGVGRLDPNYLMSLKALMFYREAKLGTIFESWPELGHSLPADGSVGLREWYALQNGGKANEEELKKEFARVRGLDPLKSWRALVELKERPFYQLEGSGWPGKIAGELKALEKDPRVSREAMVWLAHRRLLAREVKMRTLTDLREINNGYLQLHEAAAKTSQAKVVELDHRRIMGVLRQTESAAPPKKQTGTLTPDPPENERTIPRNPLVR